MGLIEEKFSGGPRCGRAIVPRGAAVSVVGVQRRVRGTDLMQQVVDVVAGDPPPPLPTGTLGANHAAQSQGGQRV
jgi:hypothetical protein